MRRRSRSQPSAAIHGDVGLETLPPIAVASPTGRVGEWDVLAFCLFARCLLLQLLGRAASLAMSTGYPTSNFVACQLYS